MLQSFAQPDKLIKALARFVHKSWFNCKENPFLLHFDRARIRNQRLELSVKKADDGVSGLGGGHIGEPDPDVGVGQHRDPVALVDIAGGSTQSRGDPHSAGLDGLLLPRHHHHLPRPRTPRLGTLPFLFLFIILIFPIFRVEAIFNSSHK
jgi:hypothetical protein